MLVKRAQTGKVSLTVVLCSHAQAGILGISVRICHGGMFGRNHRESFEISAGWLVRLAERKTSTPATLLTHRGKGFCFSVFRRMGVRRLLPS